MSVLVETPPSSASEEPEPMVVRKRFSFLRRHWIIVALFLLGTILRLMAWLAYQPALLYIDSFRYLSNLVPLDPTQLDPIGYDLLLRPLLAFGGLQLVTALQHLAGLGMAIAIYALALRHGARRWLAAFAAAWVLLDAYQVQIEQNIMADVWLEVLIVAMLWLLLGRAAPRPFRAGVAGLLLGVAFAIRTTALPLILPVLAYLIIAGGAWRTKEGWKRIAARGGALLFCFVFVLFCYAGYFHRTEGHWGLTGSSGSVLYGRTAEVANCAALKLDPELVKLCPAEPLNSRLGIDYYSHLFDYPQERALLPASADLGALQQSFARTVIIQQPWNVVRSVLVDFAKGFAVGRNSAPQDVPVDRWQFQTVYPVWSGIGTQGADAASLTYGGSLPEVNTTLAGILRTYQLYGGYTPGPLLAVCGVLGLLGGFGIRRGSGLRSAALLATGMAITILLCSAMFEFSWRYQLPGLVLLPFAGVLGVTTVIRPLRRPKSARSWRMLAPFPDPVDVAAITDFVGHYGKPAFAPVLVVIAAYNEERGIGAVLDSLPSVACDLEVSVLVVSDGCADRTALVAAEHGVYVCVAATNRGQGAALRLGYQLAAYGGARYVVTTDADGQYDNTELPLLLQPLLDDTADFVTGSRRLGVAPGDDRVRWLGVRVFAALASLLTWRKITDTSFGFRGMRTELACAIRLRQPQYQASELLLGALAQGVRLLEQPMTMRVRAAGKTKKGSNLAYGFSYARVMTWTWIREFLWYRLFRRLKKSSMRELDPTARI